MKTAIFAGLAALLAASAAPAQVNPKAMKWGAGPPGLPAGAKLTVLSGDPGKPGLFTIRLKFPPSYTIPPHRHPSDELVTVVAGQLGLGMGNTLNRRAAATLVPGGYAVAPANMSHFAFTRAGATVQITANGPFEIIYVNPRDDPRKR